MDLDRGEIYFIRERISTGFTDFTKIGRVAQSDTRNSAKRTLEHQTGNPRSLEPAYGGGKRFAPGVCLTEVAWRGVV